MFCMNCGQQLPDGAKFCLNCGTMLGAVSPTNPINSGANTPVNSQSAYASVKPAFVPAMCPNCNAHLKVDPSYRLLRCGACGTECLVQEAVKKFNVSGTVNLVHSGNVTHTGTIMHTGVVTYKKDISNEPNLYVSYASADPTLSMTMKIPRTNISSTFVSGMNQSFKLSPGNYVIKVKFGTLTRVNINDERNILIRNDGMPTRVNIGWEGGILTRHYINVM